MPKKMEETLLELVWNRLKPGEDPDTRLISETEIRELYQQGVVDPRRVSWENWQRTFQDFKATEEGYILGLQELRRLSILFYQGTIKKPFDPHRLKDGPRPLSWLKDLYQKVLKFETVLEWEEWGKICKEQLQGRFIRDKKFYLEASSKDLILKTIEQNASTLRSLEKWVHEAPEGEKEKPKAPPSKGAEKVPTSHEPIEDRYEVTPEEFHRKSAIEQLYYNKPKAPPLKDDETLDILDEIAESEDNEDSTELGGKDKKP